MTRVTIIAALILAALPCAAEENTNVTPPLDLAWAFETGG